MMDEDENHHPKLRVHCVTYNTGCYRAPKDKEGKSKILDMLQIQRDHDLIAVGFQEVHCRADKFLSDLLISGQDQWTECVSNLLIPHGYLRIRTIRVLGAILSVFSKRSHLIHLREIETSYVRLSLSGYWGFKAAVAVRLKLFGVSVAFVNCHLAAHDQHLSSRIQNYKDIVAFLTFKSPDTPNVLHHDYILWMGDLNFRLIEGTYNFDQISQHLERGEHKVLLAQDQLKQVQRERQAFAELFETEPTFPPTYKFKVGRDVYDAKRRPAWTDRILYRCNEYNVESMPLGLTSETYESHPSIRFSDHVPVSSTLTLSRFSDALARKKDLPAFNAIVRFLQPDNWRVGYDGIVRYFVEIGKMAYLNPWDYIALYKADFASLEDYVTFTFASSCKRTGIEKNVVIMEESLQHPGEYILIYFGHRNCVLGMSKPFNIGFRSSPPVEEAEEAVETIQAEEALPQVDDGEEASLLQEGEGAVGLEKEEKADREQTLIKAGGSG